MFKDGVWWNGSFGVGIFLRLQLFAQDAKSFTSMAGEKKMKYDANRWRVIGGASYNY